MSAPVVVRGLDVVLGDQRVLHHIDLTVGPGEVLALLGPNGSGKSTLVRAIVHLLRPERGSIELFGTPIGRFRDWRRIGYVPQRSTAAGGVPATVREVVGTGRLARRAPFTLRSRADRAAVDRALDMVGLADRAQDNVVDLSGGQQQRVLIARAAASEPDLLVLDEPTAGVDLHNQEVFADAVARFVAAGKAVLVVLHELGPFAPLVDHAVELDGGHVVWDGPLEKHDDAGTHAFHDHSHSEGHPLDPDTDRGLFG